MMVLQTFVSVGLKCISTLAYNMELFYIILCKLKRCNTSLERGVEVTGSHQFPISERTREQQSPNKHKKFLDKRLTANNK
jgi:hypothetical protein